MADETVIYQNDMVKITNLRAVLDGKTYAISNITSVSSKRIEPNRIMEFIFLFAGLGLVVAFVTNMSNWQNLLYGVICLGLVYFFNKISKPTYTAIISMTNGENTALRSPDEVVIKQVVEALNNAIVQKG